MNIFQKFLNLIGLKQQAAVVTTPNIEAAIAKVEASADSWIKAGEVLAADATALSALVPQAAPVVATINGVVATAAAGLKGAEAIITAIEDSPAVKAS